MLGMEPKSVTTTLPAPDSRSLPDRLIHFRTEVRTINVIPPRKDARLSTRGQLHSALVRKRNPNDKDVTRMLEPDARCNRFAASPPTSPGPEKKETAMEGRGSKWVLERLEADPEWAESVLDPDAQPGFVEWEEYRAKAAWQRQKQGLD